MFANLEMFVLQNLLANLGTRETQGRLKGILGVSQGHQPHMGNSMNVDLAPGGRAYSVGLEEASQMSR